MLALLLFLLPSLLLAAPSPQNTPDNPWGEYAAECLVGQPSVWDESRLETKWYTIDLDKEAHDRWREVAVEYKDRMKAVIDLVKYVATTALGEGVWDMFVDIMKDVPDKFTEPYKTEIYALRDLTGLSLEEGTMLNLFYEISGMCTSLVAVNYEGQVFHGRNLDFGLFFLWDTEEHAWELTEKLRDLLVQYEFVKDGKLLFKAVTFAGHLGIINGVRPGAFSVSINTRFTSSLEEMTNFFVNGLAPNQQFVLYAMRDMMTNYDNFPEARKYIETVGILKGCYFTVGSPDGGVVVTRSDNATDHEAVVNLKDPNGWYVLQTNYDWNEADIYLDDRTKPGNHCMKQLGRKNVTKEGIFQVMSSKTTLNKSTVYTAVMEIKSGALYTFKQTCKDPCWFV